MCVCPAYNRYPSGSRTFVGSLHLNIAPPFLPRYGNLIYHCRFGKFRAPLVSCMVLEDGLPSAGMVSPFSPRSLAPDRSITSHAKITAPEDP